MKNILLNRFFKTSLFLLSIIMVSCEKPEVVDFTFDGTTKTLLRDKLGAQTTAFYDAVVKAGKEDLLSGSTEYTFLVPNESAMRTALQSGGFTSIEEASPEFLADLVDDHTIEGFISSADLSKTTVQNVAGKTLYVTANDNGVFFNGTAEVVTADEASTNGIVHIVNFPVTKFPENTIADIVVQSATADTLAEFTTLLAALEATGLDATLAGGEYTVFAPTDAAFAALGLDETNVASAFTTEELTEILGYHVIAERNLSMDLSTARYYTVAGSMEDGQRGIDIEADIQSLELDDQAGTEATSINLLATNGIIHVVDNVIFPRPYIIDAIDGSFNLSDIGADGALLGAYFTALGNSTINVDSLFRSEDTVSIMVPRFFSATSDSIILNHVFEGILDISSQEGSRIESVTGAEYFVTQGSNGNTFVNGRSSIQTFTDGSTIIEDYSAYNGLVTNFFDTFTPLPAIDADSVLTDSVDFSLFNATVKFFEKGSIEGATYLVVDNSIFSSVFDEFGVPSNDVDSIEFAEDLAGLEEALNSHIITDVFFAVDLEPGNIYTDLNGDDVNIVEVTADDGTNETSQFGIQQNDVGEIRIIEFGPTLDILANNGVIHEVSNIIPVL